MTNTKYVNDQHPVIIYDSDEEKYDFSPKGEIEYTQINNTSEIHEEHMTFQNDANNLTCYDEDFSVKYFPNWYGQLGVVRKPYSSEKMRAQVYC